MTTTDARWLLLIHQIPPKPDYLRVKIGRRLQRVGAVPVKNSVYALPDTEQTYEDFQWIRTEIVDAGGDASICRAEFVDGLTSDQIRRTFRDARDADYAELADAARQLRDSLGRADREASRGRASRQDEELVRLRKRFTTVAAIDFFGAPGRGPAEDALLAAESEVQPGPNREHGMTEGATDPVGETYRGRTWVTRSGVFVDRIASAWLIRRFIDPDARFRFASDASRVAPGDVRFDMFEGEFTHEDDRCTFETLLRRFALTDPALQALGEVVHDIDLKDEKFEREDAVGIERVLSGIVAANPDDAARLDRGGQLFDELYALFSSGRATRA